MLDTAFPRPVGDIGNPDTFGFPVIVERVRGASVRRAVEERAAGLLEPFAAAGRRLVERGAVAIATSCGFLVLHQRALAASLPVPVATSSLLQVGWVAPLLAPGRRCGVLTFDAESLGPEHLDAAGAPPDTPVAGMPRDGELQRAIRADAAHLDLDAVRREVLAAASGAAVRPERRRDRAGVHQPAAVCCGPAPAPGAAGVRQQHPGGVALEGHRDLPARTRRRGARGASGG